jgi:hypothetical protein
VIAAANTHPSPVEILNISFLLVIDEIEPEKISKPKFTLFVVMTCTDRPLNKKLKRIMDHVQLLTDGWIKSGKMNPPTIDVEFAG